MDDQAKKEAQRIGVAMILGLVIGLILYLTGLGEWGNYIKPIGDIFIRALKMVIIPLVFSSIFMSIVNLGGPEALGAMGRKAVGYYFITTAIAVFLGLVFVNLIEPGIGANLGQAGLGQLSESMAQRVQGQEGLFKTIEGLVVNAIPTNPLGAMANTKILQVIVFAVVFAIVAVYIPEEKSLPVVKVIKAVESMSLALTHGIMKLAPVGIFVLMVGILSKTGFASIISLSKYMVTVVVGLSCHGVILMLVACWRLKKSPFFILKGLSSTLFTAFSTSSSTATLPITMANVEENLLVKKETAKFVLPLGATINMDGTALYESVAAIFIAQAYNIDLNLGQQVTIFLTATLAAIGAAGIPGAGLVTMSIVLTTVGLPLEGIGLILAVDRILDMFRTTINVFGDCVGTIVVNSLMKTSNSSVKGK